MREPTVDEILRDYYYAIDSSKLDESNIVIDENLVVEDSKNKYIRLFAKFLNISYLKGYRISESIILKLMNIIEYEGYEYQIMQQYLGILTDALITTPYNAIPVCADLSLQKSIEYINLYLELKDNNIPCYLYDDNIEIKNDTKLDTLIEVSDPLPMIINDMKKWIAKHSKE